MSVVGGVATSINELCDDAMILAHGTPTAEQVRAVRDRMSGPLRVAIAGRVKAGKSTLLNALVGERLAPTDASECTRIVSWYSQGFGYDVHASLKDGRRRDLRFSHDDGALHIELGSLGVEEIERIDVEWPSSNLSRMTLIDTPGLASLNEATSARARDFLALDDEERQSEADAVVYLMRHLHRRDADFLEAFFDPTLINATPVNAIAVLSRADEIGAGRLNALQSAHAIAERYSSDPRVRALCVRVVPVAGLIAEAGMTLQEHEAASLRTLAGMDQDELDRMLVSVDRFCALDSSELLIDTREHLLTRLGMFGLRLAIQKIQQGEVHSAVDLSRALVDASGLNELRAMLENHFNGRAHALKGRSALASLRECAREIARENTAGARKLLSEIERVESSTHAFAELRLVHLMLTGALKLSDEEQAEIARLASGNSTATRAGCDPDAGDEEIRNAVLAGIARWRQRAANPLLDRTSSEAFEIAARSYEGIYAELA